jgi:uncharacterized protein (TIGR02270 family)
MVVSHRAFLIELYEEYLEEGSFLYEQRRTLLHNPELTWKKIGEFEERLEAHIDGLVVGDQLALEVCKRQAAEGDFGELFAATCVFCRQNRQDLVLAIFDQLDPADDEKAGAAADALKYEIPAAWFEDFLTLLASGDPNLAPVLACAFGYRRLQCGPQLLTAMKRCAGTALPEVVWALGRIGYAPAKGPLLDYLKSEDEPVRSAAAVALARMGEPRAVDYCLDQARSNAWPILPLSLAGGRRTLSMLTELATNTGGADYLTALGLLGDPVSVPLLISRLEPPDAAAPVATALQCLTGAALYETVFVPDEVDEDELFESEREQLKQGKPLDRGDGRPFGSKVTRLSQKPEDWNRWWQTNGPRFTPGIRYRNGGPFSPARLIDMLVAEKTPHQLRWCCSEELVTRYGKDFGIETDMPASLQTTLLAEAAAWAVSSGAQYREGAWYFGGYTTSE